MRFLIDTHIMIWWLISPGELSTTTRELLADRSNRIYVRVASLWEMAIKSATGRLKMPDGIMESLGAFGVSVLPVEADHAFVAATLPPLHRNPFDRMLVAQAMHEGLTLVTRDAIVASYPVAILRA